MKNIQYKPIGSKHSVHRHADHIAEMRSMLKSVGYLISPTDMANVWEDYSYNEFAAGWMGSPDNTPEGCQQLLAIVNRYTEPYDE